jgi:hypothetical protein
MPFKIYKKKQRWEGVTIGPVGYSYGHSHEKTETGRRIVRSSDHAGDVQFLLTEPLPARSLAALEESTSVDGEEITIVHYREKREPGQPKKEEDYYEEKLPNCVVVGAATDHANQTRTVVVKCPNNPVGKVID